MEGATAGAEWTTRTVVVEIMYFCTKNVVITQKTANGIYRWIVQQLKWRSIQRMCGIDELSRRRGFADRFCS